MRLRSSIGLVGLLACCVLVVAASPQKMSRVDLKLKPCRCESKHGDVYVVCADDRKARLTKSGLASDPKVSPDQTMCGWLTGTHQKHYKYGYVYLPDTLVLFKGGKVVRSLQGKGDYVGIIVKWQFWQNGQQVALAVGSVRRGTEWYELRDIATAKLLDMKRRWTNDVPPWAAAIAEQD